MQNNLPFRRSHTFLILGCHLLFSAPLFGHVLDGRLHEEAVVYSYDINVVPPSPTRVDFKPNPTVGDGKVPSLIVFSAFKKIRTREAGDFLFVESDGMADHDMMVGITNWQQQVPLPQHYMGENMWRIPLHPVLALHPVSARNNLFRGAIALAANGIPIFNALNNRGEDSFLIGELDHFGGHAGRGDDYHYHAAPLHLQEKVGKGNPIAVALDGFLIYGLTEPNGSPMEALDSFNGHTDATGIYHYHGTRTYPYINGGMRGEVKVLGGQIEPQPHSEHVRPDTSPLRGAEITGFTKTETGYDLRYRLYGGERSIHYGPGKGGWKFVYSNGLHAVTERIYETGRAGRRSGQ